MLYRVSQFMKGITAHVTKEKEQIIDIYLTQQEKDLFNKLPRHERRHAMDTAWTIFSMDDNIDKSILVKAGLLHDIGKIEGSLGIIKKSILVLADKFFPGLCHKLSNKVNMFYIYYHHPEIGAQLLKRVNTNDTVVLLVRYHHSNSHDDMEGMGVLKKADGIN